MKVYLNLTFKTKELISLTTCSVQDFFKRTMHHIVLMGHKIFKLSTFCLHLVATSGSGGAHQPEGPS